jgi:hypothetical protein
MVKKLPVGGQHWGSARKYLNIFLRDVAYNKYLYRAYKLSAIGPWLEVPLDSHVAGGLREEQGGAVLPRWTTVIGLDATTSATYQKFAFQVAKSKGFDRVHLDLLYWRRTRKPS